MPNTLAYGFYGLGDVLNRRVTVVGVETVNDAVVQSVQQYTNDWNALMTTVVERVNWAKRRYRLPGTRTLQPLSEDGTPQPVRQAGHYEVALPLQRGGTSWGGNMWAMEKMTVEDVNNETLTAQAADTDWLMRRVFAAIFTNVTWEYDDPDDEIGTLTIQSLANGDSVLYPMVSGGSAADDHFSAQAAAISNTDNPYPILYSELAEHPSNSGPYVAYIAQNLVQATKNLSSFDGVTVEFITPGANTDTVDAGVNRYLGFGNRVIGVADEMIIVEARRLPSNYIVAEAMGAGPFVGMREEPEMTLQGLIVKPHQVNSNFLKYDYYRAAGFGIMNRVAAAVRRVGNAAYAIPTGYQAPLAV